MQPHLSSASSSKAPKSFCHKNYLRITKPEKKTGDDEVAIHCSEGGFSWSTLQMPPADSGRALHTPSTLLHRNVSCEELEAVCISQSTFTKHPGHLCLTQEKVNSTVIAIVAFYCFSPPREPKIKFRLPGASGQQFQLLCWRSTSFFLGVHILPTPSVTSNQHCYVLLQYLGIIVLEHVISVTHLQCFSHYLHLPELSRSGFHFCSPPANFSPLFSKSLTSYPQGVGPKLSNPVRNHLKLYGKGRKKKNLASTDSILLLPWNLTKIGNTTR